MANIISLKFGDKIEANTGKLNYTGNELANTDIGYWIGTQGNSVSYTDISTNGEVTPVGSLAFAFTRTTGDATTAIGATPQAWTFNNYILLPTSISLRWRTDTSGSTGLEFSYQNEQGAYESLSIVNNVGPGTAGTLTNFPVSPKFWSKSFRVGKVGTGPNFRVDEIYMYGSFRRINNSTLGLFPANSTIETVKDSQLNINSTNGPLSYQAALTSKPNKILSITRITLTGTYTIDNLANNIILCLNPNGSNRDVILPQFPRLDHYIKIINVNGLNTLNIKETSGGPVIQELSNASTVLALEAIWVQEDSTWQITS